MKTTAILKLAASTLILGTTMVGCSPAMQGSHVANASDSKMGKAANKAAMTAAKALAARDFTTAVSYAELAVASLPRDAGYRMLLGQAYLGAGRFSSAETAFSETLTLMPDHERAALNLALVQIALGKNAAALRTLADYHDKIGASDYGLALALAGDTDGGVKALEFAVTANSDAKSRQNLALAYALAGKWTNAHTMALQDLSTADADARIMQWSKFTHPVNASDQVASLLGVQPVTDQGQPTRLALAPIQSDAVEVATAAPPSNPAILSVGSITLALDDPKPILHINPQVAAFETRSARSVKTSASTAVPVIAPVAYVQTVPIKQADFPINGKAPSSVKQAIRTIQSGKFVVQLGAFESVAVSRAAWNQVASRYGLGNFEPANSNAHVNGATFVRLSVGGFSNRNEATNICLRIKSVGGSCFVRGLSSDRPAQWVQRKSTKSVNIASR